MENRYKVRKSWKDEKSQIGAYTSLKNAIKKANENPGYAVFDSGDGGKLLHKSGETFIQSMYYKATLKKKIDSKHPKGAKVTVYRNLKKEWLLEDGTIVPNRKDYLNLTKQVYNTNCKYSKADAERWVNREGFSSPTPYLFWCSKYCQKAYIFKGKKGEWKLVKTVKCGTGSIADGDPSDQGIGFKWKIFNKYKTYQGPRGLLYWVMHYSSAYGNAIHSGTVGKPSTHGCIALSSATAKWAYETLPINTKVIVY